MEVTPPHDTLSANTRKDIIIAADKYGIVGLKLAVETTLVEAMMLEDENVAD